MAGPVFTIARKELLERLASRRYVLLAAVTAFLLLMAFVSSTADYRARLKDHTASLATLNATRALHAPSPLSVLARGLEEELGRGYDVDPQLGLIHVTGRPIRASQLFQILPPIDVLYVLRVILSLVAALLAFDAISGEKQSGRLALLLSHPISRARVFMGKWLGCHVALLSVVAPAFLSGLLWMTAVGRVPVGAAELARIVGFLTMAGVYLSFFLTFGLMVSSFTHRPATSSVVVLLGWALLVFVLPNLTAQLVTSRIPVPPAQRMEERNTQAWIAAVLDRVDAAPTGQQSTEPLSGQVLRQTGGIDRDYFARTARRAQLHRHLSVLSPASALVHGVTSIAGTGVDEQLRFVSDLLAFRTRVVAAGNGSGDGPLLARGDASAAGWPRQAQLPFLSLALSTAGVLVLGMWGFNRYDAR